MEFLSIYWNFPRTPQNTLQSTWTFWYWIYSEGYQTAIDDEEKREYDVFIILKGTLMSMQGANPQLYNALTSTLSAEFQTVSSTFFKKSL